MARLKKRYWIPLTIILIAMALSFCGWRYWISFKQQQGITVDWNQLNIGFDGVSFDEFTFTKQSLLSVKSKNLRISWSTLSASDMDIHWLSNDQRQSESKDNKSEALQQTDLDRSTLATLVYWLPTTIHIDSLRYYQQDNESFNINIEANKQQQTIQLAVTNNNKEAVNLSATLTLNQQHSRIDVSTGRLTATLNNADVIKGQLTIPFTGWINTEQLFFTSTDNALISAEKLTISPDIMLTNAEAKLNFQLESPIPMESQHTIFNGQLTIDKLNGTYKQSDIKSVTGKGSVVIKNDQLTVSIDKMNINEVNLGVIFKNIKLTGTYLANLNTLDQGIISWNQAQATIFSGIISLEKGKVNLAKLPQQFNVKLKQIQLNDIFVTYPAEGLAGKGMVEGTLPIILSTTKKNGIKTIKASIKNGQLATIKEGYLQFENSAIRNYVQNNPQMKIVTDVLKNFHYTKLTGNVDYQDEIAKLRLNIQGGNPESENGKAVNLNITLEENIPKLIMSLQISEQISEPIRKRIEERLK